MHELGILVNVVRNVQSVAQENNVTKVEKIVLEVGEACGVIPDYMQKQFPIALSILNNPVFDDCTLDIKMVNAKGICQSCKKMFWLKPNKGICPYCGSEDFTTNRGTELLIKEIVAC